MSDYHAYVKFSRGSPDEMLTGFSVASTLEALQSPKTPTKMGDLVEEGTNFDEVVISSIGKISTKYMSLFPQKLSSFYGLIGIINVFHMAASTGLLEATTLKIAREHGLKIDSTEDCEIYGLNEATTNKVLDSARQARSISQAMGELPGSLLLSLVATYDSVIADFLREVLRANPEKIKNSKKTITYKEMFESGDISKILDDAIEDEIGDVLRDSHAAQVRYIESIFDVQINGKFDRLSNFLEIFERRNQYAHNSGLASSQYIRKCESFSHNVKNVRDGQILPVSPSYLRKAVDYVTEFGVLATYSAWKKSNPQEIDLIFSKMNSVSYDLIKARRFVLAGRILDFVLFNQGRGGSEATRRMMCVNLANCYARRGKDEEAALVIAKMDWSATSEEFGICIDAIKKDVPAVCNRMGSAVSSGKLKKSDFIEWPVFDNVREDPRFASHFEEIFGEPLHTEKLVDPVTQTIEQLPTGSDTQH